MSIGKTIHALRKENKMTLLELANKSGVALATLSRMENGKMTGTLKSHMKICDALGATLPDLYKNLYASKRAVDIHTQKSRTEVYIHDKKFSQDVLASKILNKKMLPILIKIDKGGKTHKESTRAGIEKFLYVLEGKIEVTIGEEKYDLMKNDTLYFDASEPHFFKNSSGHAAKLLCIISPPKS